MRILHLASGDLWAGAEQQIYGLSKALSARPDLQVAVVLLNDGILADKLRKAGLAVTVIDESRHNALSILRVFMRLLRSMRPDIVHTHRRKENIIGAIAAAFTPGVRSLRTQHGAEEIPVTWRRPAERIIRLLDWLAAVLLQRRIIAVSPDLESKLASQLPKRKLTCIANGIDCAELVNQASATPLPTDETHRLRVAFIGRLVPVKRIDLFLETAALVASERPGQFRFYVIGDGPLRGFVDQAIIDRHLSETVQVLGFRDPVAAYLGEMNALMNISDHEGLPMTVLEAMALGVPVLAHAVGGMLLALDDGHCGILIGSQNPRDYARALFRLRDEPTLAADYAVRAKARVARCFSSSHSAEQHLKLYDAISKSGIDPRGQA